MNRRLRWLSLLGVLAAQWFAGQAVHAQGIPGLKFLKPGIQAEQGKDVALKAEHGPWLVYAYTLEGPESKMQALQLASELREKFKLNSYIMSKTLDFSNSVVGSGLSKTGGEKRMRYADDRVVESYSILIGDFASPDLPEAQEALKKVKSVQPEFFSKMNFADSVDNLTAGETAVAYRSWGKMMRGDKKDETVTAGPMSYAFMIKNPLLPEEWFSAPEMDDFVTDLNKRADNSILNCPGRFTVRVAHYTGVQKMVLGGGDQGRGDNADTLEQAAAQAHMLAKLLRQAGIEAFEYHERSASSVCVGSFEELGAMDANGEFVYSNDILEVVNKFGGVKNFQPSKYGPLPVVKTLLDVVDYKTYPELTKGSEREKLVKVKQYSLPFEQIPKPIFVPRPAASGLYKKSLLGRN